MAHRAIAQYPGSNVGSVFRIMGGMVGNILQWFARTGAAFKKLTGYFLRPRHPASEIGAETRAESAPEEAGADGTATESAVATPITTATFSAPVTADSDISQDVQVSCVVPIPPSDAGWVTKARSQ
jgi:hypothetical protein